MTFRHLIVALVAAGTIGAAGLGSYLAVRSNSTEVVAEPLRAETAQPVPPIDRPTDATSVAVEPPAPAAPAELAAVEPPRDRTVAPSPRPRPGRVANAPAQREESAAPVERSNSPAPAASPAPTAPPPPPIEPPVAVRAPADPLPPAQEPAAPRFDEVVVAESSVIGIRLDSAVSSETARVEDKVTATVTRDLVVDGRTAIPSGSRLEGTVTMVDPGGKFRERARIGIRFTSLVIGDARRPIQTDAIVREGESPAKESTAKVGASAVVGAILGAMAGGKKGAVIGGTAGAAGGTAAVMAGGRQDVVLAAGTPLTVRLTAPVTILIERDRQ